MYILRFETFLSTPSARRATCQGLAAAHLKKISIHALREEGDVLDALRGLLQEISIHALREEGDLSGSCRSPSQKDFYPRPPRGGRRVGCPPGSASGNFYPRPPRGGRPRCRPAHLGLLQFLSTPSARRATTVFATRLNHGCISIHALREEGDVRTRSRCLHQMYFYPRPPRGGRLSTKGIPPAAFRFLSTPSARRATAKTETKSLFSNKLYNILHEFRRALIYNGSKNYPNHAK